MARRQVAIYINGRQVENTLKGIAAEKKKINAELRLLTRGTDEYKKKALELRQVNDILDAEQRKFKDLDSSITKLTKGGITKLAALTAGAFTTGVIIDYGKKLFDLGTQMELLQRKAATVFGNALPAVTQAAEENASAMGLTISQYVNSAAAIGDLLIPMGFMRNEAAEISTGLVDLSGALSEWTGGQIDAENVSRILSKAILGEREELKQLGISIMESDVSARLAEKGLKNLTGTMLQQAKATATLELITEKSTDAQTAFAENSDLSARKQAELSARLADISEKLATTLLPVFQNLVDFAGELVDVIGSVTDGISAMVNPAKAAVDAFDDQTAAVNKLERELNPLLERYQVLTTKTNLTAEEQDELKKVIQKIGEVTPGAITEIDNYGNALSINADKSREFLVAEKARLEFINKDAVEALKDQIEGLEARRKAFKEAVETGRGGILNVEYDPTTLNKLRQDVAAATKDIEGARAQLARLTGGDIAVPEVDPSKTVSPTAEERQAQEEAAQKLRDQREKQAEQALKDRERNLKRLADVLQGFEDDQSLARLSDDDQALEQVRRRYQKEIDLALELEAQGIDTAKQARIRLEQLRDKELLDLSIAQGQAQFDAEEALAREQEELRKQRETEFAEARFEASQQIREATREVLLAENELALIELKEHYDELRALAEEYGLDTTEIDKAHLQEKERLRKEFGDKAIKDTAAEQQAIAENYAKSYQSIANVIGSAVDLAGDKSKEGVALQKLLTLAQIGFNSASAIAAATAAGAAAGPFPANLAAIATGVATVLGNIAQARSVFADTPQFYKGGYVTAKGAQDGRTYRARYIGQAGTGMLPDSPVMLDTSIGPVLGSERGREYFVNNTALKNPVVLNHVKAIDNIVRYRQFMDGGFTTATSTASSTGTRVQDIDVAQLTQATTTLTAAIGQLVSVLSNPIYAVIDDDAAIDLRDKINKLVAASGGVL